MRHTTNEAVYPVQLSLLSCPADEAAILDGALSTIGFMNKDRVHIVVVALLLLCLLAL